MRTTVLLLTWTVASFAYSQDATEILAKTGVKGGLIVHLGCGDGRLTADLHGNDRHLVHGLDGSEENVATSREFVRSKGLYGKITIDRLRSNVLPYADNLVNLLVCEDLGDIRMTEVSRVLVPKGVAYIKHRDKWTKTVKPWPENIDQWTHHLHGPDGNAVARDTVVGPPRRLQWLENPRWSRNHDTPPSIQSAVSAGGRLFAIIDEAPVAVNLPGRWNVVARDAFNGLLLWKRPLAAWGHEARGSIPLDATDPR